MLVSIVKEAQEKVDLKCQCDISLSISVLCSGIVLCRIATSSRCQKLEEDTHTGA